MESKPKYGSIESHAESPQGLKSRSLSRENSANDSDLKKKEVSIEDALTDAGFNWTQVKYLLIVSFIECMLCAEFEALNLLGPILLCRWDLTLAEESVLTSSVFIAAFFASFFWGKFSDNFGECRLYTYKLQKCRSTEDQTFQRESTVIGSCFSIFIFITLIH